MIATVTPMRPETVAQRIKALQAEAKALTHDHITNMVAMMEIATIQAHEVADGGPVYPAGIRDLARRFAEDTEARILTITALLARQP